MIARAAELAGNGCHDGTTLARRCAITQWSPRSHGNAAAILGKAEWCRPSSSGLNRVAAAAAVRQRPPILPSEPIRGDCHLIGRPCHLVCCHARTAVPRCAPRQTLVVSRYRRDTLQSGRTSRPSRTSYQSELPTDRVEGCHTVDDRGSALFSPDIVVDPQVRSKTPQNTRFPASAPSSLLRYLGRV